VLPHAISIGTKRRRRGEEKEKRKKKRREREWYVKDKYSNT